MYLGIDIGGTRIKVGLVDDKATVVASSTIDTPIGLDAFKAALHTVVRETLESGAQPYSVGIGCKGVVDPSTARIETLPGPFHFLEGTSLSALVRPVVPASVPIFADNDARVALAGEVVWGAARGLSNAIMLTLGTGVGGGILAEGRIVRGKRGVAGHLGHVTVDAEGPLCVCGNRGCLEAFFSALAIEAEAISANHRGCQSALYRRFASIPEQLACKDVFDASDEGDEVARFIIDRSVGYLAGALAGLAHAFDPDVIILGGQITEAGSKLMNPVQQEVWKRSRRFLGRDVPIVRQKLGNASAVVGAAALARMGLLRQ